MQRTSSKNTWIISSLWLVVNVFLYMNMGIKYAIDTTRFDAEASAWINGQFEPSYHFWYTGYILVLAFFKLLFHSIYPSILFQCALSLYSTVLFYKGLCKILQQKSAAFLSALLIIIYIPIQQWNVCLLTESIFTSLILLFVWAYSIEKPATKWWYMFLIGIVAASVRPNGGILFITCLTLFSMEYIYPKNKKYVYAIALTLFLAMFLLLNYATDVFYHFLLESFKKGEIICGYSGWTVPVKNTADDHSSAGILIKITELFLTHPFEGIQLGTYRFIALWTDIRAYYSIIHNVFIGLFLFIAYTCALIGFIYYRKKYKGLLQITLLYTCLNSLLVMITYADWDGRFLVPLLPVIFIWSGLGMHYSISFVNRKNSVD